MAVQGFVASEGRGRRAVARKIWIDHVREGGDGVHEMLYLKSQRIFHHLSLSRFQRPRAGEGEGSLGAIRLKVCHQGNGRKRIYYNPLRAHLGLGLVAIRYSVIISIPTRAIRVDWPHKLSGLYLPKGAAQSMFGISGSSERIMYNPIQFDSERLANTPHDFPIAPI